MCLAIERREHGLANPPHRISDKLVPALGIVCLSSAYKAHITLGNEIGKGQSAPRIFASHAHNKAQIGCNEMIQRLLIALARSIDGFDFIFAGKRGVFANIAQIQIRKLALSLRRITRRRIASS